MRPPSLRASCSLWRRAHDRTAARSAMPPLPRQGRRCSPDTRRPSRRRLAHPVTALRNAATDTGDLTGIGPGRALHFHSQGPTGDRHPVRGLCEIVCHCATVSRLLSTPMGGGATKSWLHRRISPCRSVTMDEREVNVAIPALRIDMTSRPKPGSQRSTTTHSPPCTAAPLG